MQQALEQEYGIRELPQFIYDASGKPSLEGRPDIHFSLSHCRLAVACAVSDHPVGIDIETLDQYDEEVTRHVMNDSEVYQILNSPHPAIAFTRLWTMKESYYKLTGNDAAGDIPHLLDHAPHYRFNTVITPRFVYTVCSPSQS